MWKEKEFRPNEHTTVGIATVTYDETSVLTSSRRTSLLFMLTLSYPQAARPRTIMTSEDAASTHSKKCRPGPGGGPCFVMGRPFRLVFRGFISGC